MLCGCSEFSIEGSLYKYTPIDLGAIRLVHLTRFRAASREPIRCELFEASLSRGGQFLTKPCLIHGAVPVRTQAVLDIMPGPLRETWWWTDKRNLRTLLQSFILEASDPRDKVYALLGIASDASNSNFRPDYRLELPGVIRDIMPFLVFSDVLDPSVYTFPGWDLLTIVDNLDEHLNQVLRWAFAHNNEKLMRRILADGDCNVNIPIAHFQVEGRCSQPKIKAPFLSSKSS